MIPKLARTATLLYCGTITTWLALTGIAIVLQPSPLVTSLFVGGVYALWSWILFALLTLCCAPLLHFHCVALNPPQPLTRRDAITSALFIFVLAILVAGSYRLAPQLVNRILPERVDLRPLVVEAGSWCVATSASYLIAFGIFMLLRRRMWRLFFIVAAVLFLTVRILVHRPLQALFPTYHGWLDLFTLAICIVAFIPSHPLLFVRWIRRGMFVANGIAFASIVFLFTSVENHAHSRATLEQRFSGASTLLGVVRNWFDLDGDGVSSILGGHDCDDSNPLVSPNALEIVGNGLDDNCMGGDLDESAVSPNFDSPTTRPSHDSPRRSTILITIDAWRADTLFPTSSELNDVMPKLRRFSEKSARFSRAYAQAPYTDHSIRSLMTGRYPMDFEDAGTFYGQEQSLAELFAEHGFDTVCLQQVWLINPYALVGCRRVDDEIARANEYFNGRTSAQMTDKALQTFDALVQARTPFFLWVHYFDPHSNYLSHEAAPDTLRAISRRDEAYGNYLQEVWSTDRELGRFLDAIVESRFLDEGYVVVTGDHGEHLGEREKYGHAWWLDEAILKVPLVLRGPKIPTRHVTQRIRLIDLYPTIADYAMGWHIPSDGASLRPMFAGHETADRPIFARSLYRGSSLRAAIFDQHKLIQDLKHDVEYLYDLASDPDETNNRIEERPELAASLRHRIGERWDRSLNDRKLADKAKTLHRRLLPSEQIQRYNLTNLRRECQHGQARACEEYRLRRDCDQRVNGACELLERFLRGN